MEREREEEHEGTEGRVGLKVNMDMMAAALQIRTRGYPMPMVMPVSVVVYKGCPLVPSPCHFLTIQDKPLQDEDHEEAGSHDELWEGEVGLCESNI